jgi:chorismate dehydratase
MKTVADTLRLGKIRYTNCIPFYHGLEAANVELCEDVPAGLNEAMREGRIDIAPVSSLEYLLHQNDYRLLPSFVIGAKEFSGSVLLFSRVKIENLKNEAIALTQESLSSSALLKILLKHKYGLQNTFEVMESNPDRMLASCTAALVIGDDALFYEPKEFIYKYDLSELWSRWTGKSFCFAVWAVRREFLENNPGAVTAFSAALKKNLKKNLLDLETLVPEALGFSMIDARFAKTVSYLSNLHYQFDETMREGLMLFYHWAHKSGLAPCPSSLEFFEP